MPAPPPSPGRASLLGGGTKPRQAGAGGGGRIPAIRPCCIDWARALRAEHQDAEAHRHAAARRARRPGARPYRALVGGSECRGARLPCAAGDAKGALALVDHAALPVGDEYAEQQFLGGFIALRFLKDPAAALPYFQRLDANVTRPISKSRAEYWQGRAYEALGDTASAVTPLPAGRRLSRNFLRPARPGAHRNRAGAACE